MKPKLTFQKEIFWDESKENELEVAKRYFSVKEIDKNDVLAISTDEVIDFRGSIILAQRLKRLLKQTDALYWASKMRNEMLDKYFYFTDMTHIETMLKSVDRGSLTKRRFIRPTSGSKIFSGNVFDYLTFKNEIEYLKQRNIDPSTIICLISHEFKIHSEYRTIFIDGEYISGCRYMMNSQLNVDSIIPDKIIAYAKDIHKKYDLPPWIVIDVADCDGNENTLNLIELNQFETSSFYLADLEKIYYAWNQAWT